LHILFLESHYPSLDGSRGGGAGTYVRIVAQELTIQGYKVSVITGFDNNTQDGYYKDQDVEVYTQNISSHVLWYLSKIPLINTFLFRSIEYLIKGYKKYSLIKKIHKKCEINIIEYSSVGDFWQSIYKSIPYIVHLHGSKYTIDRYLNKNITFSDRLMNYFVRYFYKNASFIISPSKWMISEVEKENKINFQKKLVLKYPISYFDSSLLNNEINKKIRFFMAARDDAAKGWNQIIAAIENLSESYLNKSEFVFFGLANINKIKNRENVRVHKFSKRSEILEELKKSNVALVPSWVDNSPNTIYEAMAFGKAVIASNRSGIPELVENNKTGILVDPMNINELRKSIEFMIDNPIKVIEYGREGYNYISKKAEIKSNIQIRLGIWEEGGLF
jgi:glycosyltransferase involved in cell wall biosynthesis